MPRNGNSFARGVNRPLFVACVVLGCGLAAEFARDIIGASIGQTRNDVRITAIENFVEEHKKVSITREEFNRLDHDVQQKAGKEELQAIERRIDDIRSDLADIKNALGAGRRGRQ